MWNGTMFVDLDWPLNASSLLSASAELLVHIYHSIGAAVLYVVDADNRLRTDCPRLSRWQMSVQQVELDCRVQNYFIHQMSSNAHLPRTAADEDDVDECKHDVTLSKNALHLLILKLRLNLKRALLLLRMPVARWLI